MTCMCWNCFSISHSQLIVILMHHLFKSKWSKHTNWTTKLYIIRQNMVHNTHKSLNGNHYQVSSSSCPLKSLWSSLMLVQARACQTRCENNQQKALIDVRTLQNNYFFDCQLSKQLQNLLKIWRNPFDLLVLQNKE